VIELRQDLPLGAEALQDVVCIEAAFDDLDRNFLAVLIVGARCQVNGAQPAAADLTDDPISAKRAAGELIRRQQVAWNRSRRRLDEGGSLIIGGEERLDFRAQVMIALAQTIEQARAIARLELDRGIKDFFDALPRLSRLPHRAPLS
jgi:hypothetical protein